MSYRPVPDVLLRSTGRRYSDGLHQAIEAKERVKVEAATQTFATITLQNYFRMYHKLSFMSLRAIGRFVGITTTSSLLMSQNSPASVSAVPVIPDSL